jgi:hypothetical protein
MESQRDISCREIVQFGEKLAIALSTLVELDRQESFKYVDKKFDPMELYKTIFNAFLKARFGAPDRVESEDIKYSLIYKCIEDDDPREAYVSITDTAEAGIIFSTMIYIVSNRTKVE